MRCRGPGDMRPAAPLSEVLQRAAPPLAARRHADHVTHCPCLLTVAGSAQRAKQAAPLLSQKIPGCFFTPLSPQQFRLSYYLYFLLGPGGRLLQVKEHKPRFLFFFKNMFTSAWVFFGRGQCWKRWRSFFLFPYQWCSDSSKNRGGLRGASLKK